VGSAYLCRFDLWPFNSAFGYSAHLLNCYAYSIPHRVGHLQSYPERFLPFSCSHRSRFAASLCHLRSSRCHAWARSRTRCTDSFQRCTRASALRCSSCASSLVLISLLLSIRKVYLRFWKKSRPYRKFFRKLFTDCQQKKLDPPNPPRKYQASSRGGMGGERSTIKIILLFNYLVGIW